MIVNQTKNGNDAVEFTFPRQVWESFSALKRGVGCEFLTTNLTKMSVHKISLFKYLDDGVRVKLTVSSLLEAPVDRPEYIKIEGVQLAEIPSQEDNRAENILGHDTCKGGDESQSYVNAVQEFSALVAQDNHTPEHEGNCAPMELVFDDETELDDDTGTKSGDCTITASECLLPELERPNQEIVTVREALEVIRNENQQRLSQTTITDEESLKVLEHSKPDSLTVETCITNAELQDVLQVTPRDKALIKTEDSVALKPFSDTNQCPVCSRIFKSKLQISRHITKDHVELSSNEKLELTQKLKVHLKQQCNICGNLYANANVLRGHMEVMHTTHVQAQCPVCGVKVKNEKALAGHMKRIHEQREKKYLCHLCPASFRVQNYLNGHMKAVHPEAPKDAFSCDLCDFKSSYKKYIHLHKNRVHRAKKFQCTFCERKFSSGSNLKRHIETIHSSSELPQTRYLCRHCNKTFSNKGNLKLHHARAHRLSDESSSEQNNSIKLQVKDTTEEDEDTDKSVLEGTFGGYILFDYQQS